MMLPIRRRQQKICVICLAKHEDTVLLLRGSRYDDEASFGSIGYFGPPRFTLRFGLEPAELIIGELRDQFGQDAEAASVVHVSERMIDDYTQEVELVYRVNVANPVEERTGRYVFAKERDLEKYVLPAELERLREWLRLAS